MFINKNIQNKTFIQRQKFGQNSLDILPTQNVTQPIQNKEINLNNTPSVQNQVIIQNRQPEYKELQTFNIPNIGGGKIYELKNGHKVIILPKAGNTVLHTEVNAGRAYEPKGKEGISHLLEHVLFENHDFEKMGGILGGQTGEIHTNFWGEFPVETPQELEKMIEIQSNIILKNKIPQTVIDKEKLIIEQERNTFPVTTNMKAIDSVYSNLFNGKYEPLDPAGNKESLGKITRDDLVEYYNTLYSPDGNVDSIAAETKIIDSITAKDVENFAQQTIDLNKVSMLVIHPQKIDNVNFKGNKLISENIEEYNLENNLHVVVDSQPGTTRTIASFKLIPSKEIKTKPGVESLLFMMSDNKDEAFNETTSKILGSTYIMSGTIETSAECSPSKTYTALWSLKNGINSNLSEENFEAQKRNIKRYLTEESEKPSNIGEEKLGMFWLAENRPRKEILNNLDNIKLQDVQNYYKELKANSFGEVVLTIPPDLYKNDKQKILSTLSTGFPPMQKYQPIGTKIPMPSKLEKSEMLIKPREDGEIIIDKKFQIPYSQNLKDEETFALLNVIADKRINNDLRENQKLAYLAHSDTPPTNSNRIINFHIQTSSNDSENLKKSLDGFSKITQDLIENKVSEKELNNAKIRLRIRNMNNISESAKRNEEIKRGMTTPYGKDYLDENLKTLNEIQSEHIQRMAQMVFQKPSITIIEANRATLNKNKDYLKLQGNMTVFYPNKEQ